MNNSTTYLHPILRTVLVACFCASALFLNGQQYVAVKDFRSAVKADSLRLYFHLRIPQTLVSKYSKVIFSPYVCREGLERFLPEIVAGTSFAQVVENRKDLWQTSEDSYYRERRDRFQRIDSCIYRVAVPFESWMKNSFVKLDGYTDINGYKRKIFSMTLQDSHLVINWKDLFKFQKMELELIQPSVSNLHEKNGFLLPAHQFAHYKGQMKDVRNRGIFVDFPMGSSAIDPDFKDNKINLQLLNSGLREIIDSADGRIYKILLCGFASPDGDPSKNKDLAFERVESLKRHIATRHQLDQELFEVYNGAIDWDGLKEKLSRSNRSYAKTIIQIIDQEPELSALDVPLRLRKIQRFLGGEPYKEMKEAFFPSLRNAGYVKVYYEQKPDKNLDIINHSITLLNGGEYKKALDRIKPLSSDPRVYFPIGVCFMMEGDLESAKEYLRKALLKGEANAKFYLDQIVKYEKM